MEEDFLATRLMVDKVGDRFEVRHQSHVNCLQDGIKIAYRLDVPYRTEVRSFLDHGKQTITGIMGPIRAGTNKGDIRVSYVSEGVVARSGTGDLDLQVIGGRVEAKTGSGNISCSRLAQGVHAETGDGEIILVVVGPSRAVVKKGTGKIDAGGVRGAFLASTDAGDLHVKAFLHDDWQLSSVSGNIHLELPPGGKFEVDAVTNSGELLVNRSDVTGPQREARQLHGRVNGGGKHIEAHTDSGRIVIR